MFKKKISTIALIIIMSFGNLTHTTSNATEKANIPMVRETSSNNKKPKKVKEKKVEPKDKPKEEVEPKKEKKIVKKSESKKERRLKKLTQISGNKVKNYTKITANLSFYTGLVSENTSHGSVDARGNQLVYGTIANNDLPLGTKIYIEGYGIMTVRDRGGSGLHNNNFDVFIPRKNGESDDAYYKRVNNKGIKHRKAYILYFGEE